MCIIINIISFRLRFRSPPHKTILPTCLHVESKSVFTCRMFQNLTLEDTILPLNLTQYLSTLYHIQLGRRKEKEIENISVRTERIVD